MKTFIGLTFAFLAFAFYEMSGGEDFEPASDRFAAAQVEPVTRSYIQDQKIVDQGEIMTQLHINAIEETSIFAPSEQASAGLLAVVAVKGDGPPVVFKTLIGRRSVFL